MQRTDKLSILFVTRKFPPSVGGMQRYSYDLYHALRPQATIHLVKWGGANTYLPVVLPVFFVRCCWILLTRRIDIIHMQDGLLAPLGGVLKFLFRKPDTIVIHGLDVTHPQPLYQKIIPPALDRFDHIFSVSGATRDQAVAHHIAAAKIEVIPLGITDNLYMPEHAAARKRVIERIALKDDGAHLLLATGRLVKRKGVNWFIDNVLPELVAKDLHIVLLVSGDGPERETIDATVQKRRMQGHVHMLGRTDDSFIRDLYNGCDVYIMPNITVAGDMEGFGRVLVEAALCELPVVATGIEGIRDAIIDGKNGTLIKEKNVAAFVRVITSLTDNPKQRARLGKAARDFTLETFNWPKIAARFLDAYRQLVPNQ